MKYKDEYFKHKCTYMPPWNYKALSRYKEKIINTELKEDKGARKIQTVENSVFFLALCKSLYVLINTSGINNYIKYKCPNCSKWVEILLLDKKVRLNFVFQKNGLK